MTDHLLFQTDMSEKMCAGTPGREPELVVRARGLPWSATAQDVYAFFEGSFIHLLKLESPTFSWRTPCPGSNVGTFHVYAHQQNAFVCTVLHMKS